MNICFTKELKTSLLFPTSKLSHDERSSTATKQYDVVSGQKRSWPKAHITRISCEKLPSWCYRFEGSFKRQTQLCLTRTHSFYPEWVVYHVKVEVHFLQSGFVLSVRIKVQITSQSL